MTFTIRIATESDVPALVPIIADWGYPSDEPAIAQRFARLNGSATDAVYVAEAADGAIAGWIHGSEHHSLASATFCEISGLAVARTHRKFGVGRALVESVRTWAAKRGLKKIQVHSNVIRQEAHPFYESLGFRRSKTQHVYTLSV
jgi:GNAT superfamily N-acetyltransferase